MRATQNAYTVLMHGFFLLYISLWALDMTKKSIPPPPSHEIRIDIHFRLFSTVFLWESVAEQTIFHSPSHCGRAAFSGVSRAEALFLLLLFKKKLFFRVDDFFGAEREKWPRGGICQLKLSRVPTRRGGKCFLKIITIFSRIIGKSPSKCHDQREEGRGGLSE